VATDLNLHRRIGNIGPETADDQTRDREIRNRERTWIIAFILDRSFSAQLGKPNTIQEEYVVMWESLWSPCSSRVCAARSSARSRTGRTTSRRRRVTSP
jgi:hypothetical protein